MSAGTKVIALMLLLATSTVAQQNQAPLDPNAIMGFESVGTWNVTGSSSPPGFMVASSTTRTQGSAAYAITNPPNLMKVISKPIASTATALAGIGDAGALLLIDVQLPAQPGNAVNSGYIQGYVTSMSRGLSKVALAQVSFNSFRTGMYNTISFAIPDSVRSALDGATFSDLTFEFDISSPGKPTGTDLLDNLRVHSVSHVQSPTGTPPPPGYGGVLNLDVPGDMPLTLVFNLETIQIPQRVHLKTGTVGATTVKFQLGLEGNPAFSCIYGGDGSDSSNQSYISTSCSNGFQPGDLVKANWVQMEIDGGDSSQKIRAQLAVNPVGSLVGRIIPPMPTYFGPDDSCMPAPKAGTVVTTSPSCADQTAKANQIITDYFNQVQNANPPKDWIVLQTTDSAGRRHDGTPTNNLISGPAPSPADPPFDTGGDLNPGGTFDAYWRLNGNLTPTAVAGTDDNTTHFDATFAAHAVLFGEDLDVLDVKVVADTDSGETTPTYKAATSTGNLGFFVFGNEIPSNGFSVDPSTGFSVDPTWSQEFDAPPIEIWIFTITLGATAEAELNASGSAAVSGLDLSVTPSASLGAHISGGIDLVIASGTVDAKVNLVTLSTPVTAQAKWVLNTSPSVCAATLNGSLKGDLDLSSGGGEVDLDATFGFCPFCYTDSETLYKWGPLASKTWNLFSDTIDTQLFGLPASLCSFPVTVSIVSPTSGSTLSSGLPVSLQGSAKPNDSSLPYSSTYNWTYTPGANASTVSGPTTGANPNVTFGAPTSGSTSSWTLNLSGTVTVNGAGGTKVTSTASAAPVTITVTNLSNGVYIAQVVSATNGPAIPDSNGVLQLGNVPGAITIAGKVVGGSGTLNTMFTVAPCTDGDSSGYSATCSTTGGATILGTTNASSTTPSAIWTGFIGGAYKVTMITTAGGSTYGTASAIIFGFNLF
jgi:hypothetical protein